MEEGCGKLIGGVLALIIVAWLALQGLAYGGMAFIIGVEYLALSFTWIGVGSPVIGWGLLGTVAGGLAGLLIGLNRAGRDLKPAGMIGGSLVLAFLLLFSGVSATESSNYGTTATGGGTPPSSTETGGESTPQSNRARRTDGQIEQDERRASNESSESTSGNGRSEDTEDASKTDENSSTKETTDREDSEEEPKITNPLEDLAERRDERRREEEEEEQMEIIPVEVVSVDIPAELTVGEQGTFTATINEEEATPPVSSNWEFGDGTTDDDRVAAHAYDEPGTYTVRYRASNEGASDVASSTVTVEEESSSSLSFRSGASAKVSVEEYDFQITVLGGKAIEAPGGDTRLDVEVRQKSVNYDGDWVRWGHILKESYLVAGGQRYDVQRAASDNLGSESASSGGTRTGTLVFQLDVPLSALERPTLHFAYFPYRGVQSTRLPFSVE
jgi:PKD repeat protein